MEIEKATKYLKQFAIAYIILFIIIIVLNYINKLPILNHLVSIGCILLLIMTYKGAKEGKMYGAICGIVVAGLMFVGLNIINIILAAFLLINCINFIRALKKG